MYLDMRLCCLHLRDHDGAPREGKPEHDATPEAGMDEGGAGLRCVQCRKKITDAAARQNIKGQHRHVFFNPHGHVFELGCFSSAPGCAVLGPSSEEFTWFAGYAWQVALCDGCGLHMGWLFRGVAVEGAFWGLILPHLVEDQDE